MATEAGQKQAVEQIQVGEADERAAGGVQIGRYLGESREGPADEGNALVEGIPDAQAELVARAPGLDVMVGVGRDAGVQPQRNPRPGGALLKTHSRRSHFLWAASAQALCRSAAVAIFVIGKSSTGRTKVVSCRSPSPQCA